MKWIKQIMLKSQIILFLLAANFSAMAEDSSSGKIVESLHRSGKIYVVVVVISIIFLVITTFLFTLERKISKLEKQLKNKS
jgi:protein-S-isoprenylcysteine O-methyltransferase Ste14